MVFTKHSFVCFLMLCRPHQAELVTTEDSQNSIWRQQDVVLSSIWRNQDNLYSWQMEDAVHKEGEDALKRIRRTEVGLNELETSNEIINIGNCSDPPYCSLQGKRCLRNPYKSTADIEECMYRVYFILAQFCKCQYSFKSDIRERNWKPRRGIRLTTARESSTTLSTSTSTTPISTPTSTTETTVSQFYEETTVSLPEAVSDQIDETTEHTENTDNTENTENTGIEDIGEETVNNDEDKDEEETREDQTEAKAN
ncbi:uncharacterized protein LOC111713538 isoform X2 [Eurytemora carolleeae]|uniref:uncharacterized protein LOC111713538 isoform X2 n=1 Tax=Eurytemora carolleeae TaxID=1294199 RepID=UPI000C76B73B|nr:uncharacterized protein LOC111713538 isoform X2 [Eurytemora carolleeae]|eukprot:XP_023344193.1 uncharacterized protein LOC111713538 isoform X2 [Eurytemora affinis]